MFLEDKVVFVLVICLTYGVILSSCEVIRVNRNVTDSFRVGKDGCTNNASVCQLSNEDATCQPDTGLCLCPAGSPTFRNPIVEEFNSSLRYGTTYGCVKNTYVHQAAATVSEIPVCLFSPFQVLPYSRNAPVTTIYHSPNTWTSCSLLKAWVKFPDNFTEMELQWLNESYVNLKINSSNAKALEFKWKRSVPSLQGTIITLSLKCLLTSNSDMRSCLRAKVLGTWPTDTHSTLEVSQSNSSTNNSNSTFTMGTSPTTLANSNTSDEVTSSDDDPNVTIIAIAVVIPVVLLVVVIVVIWLLCRRKNRYSGGSYRMKNASGPSTSPVVIALHEDGPTKSTPDIKRIEVNGDLYAIPEKKKPKDDGLNYMDPSVLNITSSKENHGMESDQPTEYAAIVGVMKAVEPAEK